MKCYIIMYGRSVILICQQLVKGKVIESQPPGDFEIGNDSPGCKALALAIMRHYYGATGDPGAEAEAQRKAEPFRCAFLACHQMAPGSRYEITSEIIDRWNALQ